MHTRSQTKRQEGALKRDQAQAHSVGPKITDTNQLEEADEQVLPHGFEVSLAQIAIKKRQRNTTIIDKLEGRTSKVAKTVTKAVTGKSKPKKEKKKGRKSKANHAGKTTSQDTTEQTDQQLNDGDETSSQITPDASPKQKKWPSNKHQLGHSPFPEHTNPTSAEAFEVASRLQAAHGPNERPETMPIPSRTVAGCGEVNFVLEALIRTLISAHVAMENANKAVEGMAYRYEIFESGVTPNCLNWRQVLDTDKKTLEEAIRPAGIQTKRSAFILGLLEKVRDENELLCREVKSFMQSNSLKEEDLMSDTNERGKIITIQPSAVIPAGKATAHLTDESGEKLTDACPFKITQIEQGDNRQVIQAKIMSNVAIRALLSDGKILTLDFMHAWPDKVVFEYMRTFNAVGVKTSACVALFCLQRPLFAMDTHLHRICRMLKWVPDGADFDEAFFHCDSLVPNELKYCLHQLMIKHGQQCARCKAGSDPKSDAYKDATCCLEDLLARPEHKPRKKAADTPKPKKGKTDSPPDAGTPVVVPKKRLSKDVTPTDKRSASKKRKTVQAGKQLTSGKRSSM